MCGRLLALFLESFRSRTHRVFALESSRLLPAPDKRPDQRNNEYDRGHDDADGTHHKDRPIPRSIPDFLRKGPSAHENKHEEDEEGYHHYGNIVMLSHGDDCR